MADAAVILAKLPSHARDIAPAWAIPTAAARIKLPIVTALVATAALPIRIRPVVPVVASLASDPPDVVPALIIAPDVLAPTEIAVLPIVASAVLPVTPSRSS
jgi:hypothetical protein